MRHARCQWGGKCFITQNPVVSARMKEIGEKGKGREQKVCRSLTRGWIEPRTSCNHESTGADPMWPTEYIAHFNSQLVVYVIHVELITVVRVSSFRVNLTLPTAIKSHKLVLQYAVWLDQLGLPTTGTLVWSPAIFGQNLVNACVNFTVHGRATHPYLKISWVTPFLSLLRPNW